MIESGIGEQNRTEWGKHDPNLNSSSLKSCEEENKGGTS
jgi:hypothetical protein